MVNKLCENSIFEINHRAYESSTIKFQAVINGITVGKCVIIICDLIFLLLKKCQQLKGQLIISRKSADLKGTLLVMFIVVHLEN